MTSDQKELFPLIAKWIGNVLDTTRCGENCRISWEDADKVVIENKDFSIGFRIPYGNLGDVDTVRLKRRAISAAVAWSRTIFEQRLKEYVK